MAKITTITNPLTGQPTQVDQLDHTAQQIDDAVGRALPGGYYDKWVSQLPGQNLLDNSVFVDGCLVDQRGGYVVKPGTPYYKEMWTQSGTTSSYIKVKSVDFYGNLGVIEIDGVEYYITEVKTNCVRGYTGSGYGPDRWASNGATVLITDDGVIITGENVGIYQKNDNYKALSGQSVTLSILAKSRNGLLTGSLISGSFRHDFTSDGLLLSETVTLPELTAPLECWVYHNGEGMSTLKAAKLELGDQQTLAHQDSSGKWVLNELPNYADTLARCQRYRFKPPVAFAGPSDMVAVSSDTLYGNVVFPVQMRSQPSISNIRFRKNSTGEVFTPTGYAIGLDGGNDGFNTIFMIAGSSLVTGEHYAVDYEAIADL